MENVSPAARPDMTVTTVAAGNDFRDTIMVVLLLWFTHNSQMQSLSMKENDEESGRKSTS